LAIRKGMVKSAVQPKSLFPMYRTPFTGGVSAVKSKLLQKISYSLDRSDEVLDDQRENTEDSSEPLEATRNRTTRSTWLLTPRPAS
jgi:hypothetical protein